MLAKIRPALMQAKELQLVRTRGQTRQITTKHINRVTGPMRDILDTSKETWGEASIVRMNREHRQNQLTENFTKNIIRNLKTLETDDQVKIICLMSEKHQSFSIGTDFRSILFFKDDHRKQAELLKQLYDLQSLVASMNKPLLVLSNGNTFNSAASIFSSASLPLANPQATLCFNEVKFGFVPHAGATYHLSRLEKEMGTFLALTGHPIRGNDAVYSGLAVGQRQNTTNLADDMRQAGFFHTMPPFGYHERTDGGRENPNHLDIEERRKHRNDLLLQDLIEKRRKLDQPFIGETFVKPGMKKRSGTGVTDFNYLRELREIDDALSETQDAYFQQRHSVFANYLMHEVEAVRARVIDLDAKPAEIFRHQDLIQRCFLWNSVEEIMEHLRAETSPFAQTCLKMMEQNSKVSMQLALEMLRKAKNLDFKRVLEMEMTVAVNRLKDREFEEGVQRSLLKKQVDSSVQSDFLPKDQLQAYFHTPDDLKDLVTREELVTHSMLPTKHYYEHFPDILRLYINEQSTNNPQIRQNWDYELQEVLRCYGIDNRDTGLTIKSAREHLMRLYQMGRYHKEQTQRAMLLAEDSKLREKYFGGITQAIEAQIANQSQLVSKLNQAVQEQFEQAYLNQLKLIFEKSKEARGLDKKRFFFKLKRYLLRHRIMENFDTTFSRVYHRSLNYSMKIPHFAEHPTQSHIGVANPDLVHSPLWHIHKAVGKIQVAPSTLAQHLLTSKTLGKTERQMELNKLYTFNKEELQKLKNDILADPEKYQKLLQDDWTGDWRENDEIVHKFEEYEYWFRHKNEGNSPFDQTKLFEEWQELREHTKNLGANAVDTLRLLVNRLIKEIEESEQKGKGDLEASTPLHRLYCQMNGIDIKEYKSIKEEGIDALLKKGSPKVKTIQQLINLTDDKKLKVLIEIKENESKPIREAKEKIQSAITKNIELALIHKGLQVLSDEELKKRLESLNSKVGELQGSLGVIDGYLKLYQKQELVKEAYELMQPLITEQTNSAVLEATNELLQKGFLSNETLGKIFLQHKLNTKYWFIKKHPLFKRHHNLTEIEQIYEAFNELNPKQSSDKILKQAAINLGKEVAKVSYELKMNPYAFSEKEVEQMYDEAIKKDWEAYNKTKREVEDQNATIVELAKQERQQTKDKIYNVEHEFSQDWQDRVKKPFAMSDFEKAQWEYFISEIRNLKSEVSEELSDPAMFAQPHEILDRIVNVVRESDFDSLFLQNRILKQKMQNHYGENASWSELADFAEYLSTQIKSGKEEQYSSKDKKEFLNLVFDNVNKSKKHDIEGKKEPNLLQMYKQGLRDRFEQNRTKLTSQLALLVPNEEKERLKERTLELIKSRQSQNDYLSNVVESEQIPIVMALNIMKEFEVKEKKQKFREVMAPFDSELGKNYLQTKLDEKSLNVLKVELKSIKVNLTSAETLSMAFDKLGSVLNKMHPNLRAELTLQDLMTKMPGSQVDNLAFNSDELLQNALQKRIGQRACAEERIGFSYQDHHTHPALHDELNSYAKKFKKWSSSSISDLEEKSITSESNLVSASKLDEMAKTLNRDVILSCEPSEDMQLRQQRTKKKLFQLLTQQKVDEAAVQKELEEYTQIRWEECMMRPQFKKKLESQNRQMYIEQLKRSIEEELGISQESELTQRFFMDNEKLPLIDFENKYTANSAMEESVGYQNLTERMARPELSQEIGHKEPIDKLLSDYFVQQRKMHKSANTLQNDLNSLFDVANHKQGFGSELEFANIDYSEQAETAALIQSAGVKQEDTFQSQRLNDYMFLDNTLRRHFQDDKAGLSDALAQAPEWKDIPEYFEKHDPRRPPQDWVDDHIKNYVKHLFEKRLQVEKTMTRAELRAYDQEVVEALRPEKLEHYLKKHLALEGQEIQTILTEVDQHIEGVFQEEINKAKFENLQPELNATVQNENVKFVQALSLIKEQRNLIVNKRHLKKNQEYVFEVHNFENWYRDTYLQKIAQMPAEPVNEDDYRPKTLKEKAQANLNPYLNHDEQQESFKNNYTSYLEDKKQEMDRNKLYFVLEQFNEVARKDPMNDVSQTMKDFFSKEENFGYYESNKIV